MINYVTTATLYRLRRQHFLDFCISNATIEKNIKDAPRHLLHGTVLKISVRLNLAYFMTQQRFQIKIFC